MLLDVHTSDGARTDLTQLHRLSPRATTKVNDIPSNKSFYQLVPKH